MNKEKSKREWQGEVAWKSILNIINQPASDCKLLERIIETIPSAFVLVNAEDRQFLYANRQARKIYGLNGTVFDAEALKTRVKVLKPDGTPYPPEELPVSRSIKTRTKICNVEMLIEGDDGVRRSVLVNTTPLLEETGKVSLVIISFEDITERKRTEQVLKESEARYRSVFENSMDAILLTKPDGSILSANPAACRMFGMSEEEIIRAGREGLTVDREHVRTLVRERNTKGKLRYELRLKRKDDTIFTGDSTSSLFTDADGSIKTSMIIRDITVSKRNEANLTFLAGLAEDFARLASADEIIQVVGEKLGKHLNITNFLLAEIDEAEDKVHVVYAWRATGMPEIIGVYQLSAFTTDEFLRAARAGKTIIIRNTQIDPRTDAARNAELKIHSYVAVPLRQRNQWKYLFAVTDSSPRDWQWDEIELIQEITSRTFPRIEQARAEEQLLFQANLLSQVHEAVIGLDLNFFVTYWNKGAERVLGWKAREVLGKNARELLQVKIADSTRETEIAKLLATGHNEGETAYKSKNGSFIICETNVSTLKNTKGETIGIVTALHDITERKQAEKEAELSKNRVKDILSSISDSFMALDRNWNILYINNTNTMQLIAKAVGLEKSEDFVGKNFWQLASMYVGTEVEKNLKATMEKREIRRWETLAKITGRWQEMISYPAAEGITILTVDITECKKAQVALDFQAQLLSQVHEAIISFDKDFVITYWNNAAEQIFGWKKEEALGKKTQPLLQIQFEGITREQAIEKLESEGHWEGEVRYLRKDGTYFPADVKTALLKDTQGEIAGSVGVVRDITERKTAEEQLKKSELRHAFLLKLSDALRTLADPIEVQGAAVRVLGEQLAADRVFYTEIVTEDNIEYYLIEQDYHSPRATNLAGRYPVDSFGRPVTEAFHAGQVLAINNVDIDLQLSDTERKAYQDLSVYAYIGIPLIKQGKLVAILSVHNTTPRVWTPDEIALVGETAERTWAAVERAQAEEDLRASEQRYRTLFDSIDEGFCIIEVIFDTEQKPIDYRFLEMNPAFERQTGLKHAIGRRISELVPEHEEHWFQIYGEIALTGKPKRFENPARALNRYYNVFAFKVDSPESRKVAVLFRDISEIKKVEKELRDEQARLQAIIDSLPVGLWITDKQGKMVLVNNSARIIWGGKAPRANTIQEYEVYKAWWPDTGKLITAEEMPLARALEGETRKDEIINFERFDGTCGTQIVSSAPIRDADGRLIGSIAVIQDITKQKELEHSLREADRQKNQFLAMLSHELRNPLAAIHNSLTILDRVPPESEQAKRGKAIIDRQTSQLTHLVDDLLDVSRITQNKIVLQKERLELNELLERVIEDHKTALAENGLELKFQRADASLYVQADPVRLYQVFGNLLQNAIKFTPRGGSITITVTPQPAEEQVTVHLADTGIGIAPEMLPKLFKPFVQSSTSLDRQGSGLGLGLALVKGMVELHGGQVTAASAGLGKGAEFSVTLPLAEKLASQTEPEHQPRLQKGKKILIIDDNVDLAESLQELLEMDEHIAATAFSGPEGLSKAREIQPEVILCDIGLPGMDGYEVARELRKDEQLKHVFLIALTGYALPDDLKRAKEAGFDYHLKKPIDITALEQMMMDLPVR